MAHHRAGLNIGFVDKECRSAHPVGHAQVPLEPGEQRRIADVFSLLESSSRLRLCPAYGLINTLVYSNYERIAALAIDGQKRPFDTLDRSTVEKLGVSIGLASQEVGRSLDSLAKAFASARTLEFGPRVQLDDFRINYREVIRENATRIFA